MTPAELLKALKQVRSRNRHSGTAVISLIGCDQSLPPPPPWWGPGLSPRRVPSIQPGIIACCRCRGCNRRDPWQSAFPLASSLCRRRSAKRSAGSKTTSGEQLMLAAAVLQLMIGMWHIILALRCCSACPQVLSSKLPDPAGARMSCGGHQATTRRAGSHHMQHCLLSSERQLREVRQVDASCCLIACCCAHQI